LNGTKRKIGTSDFFATHPVFSLQEAAQALAPPGGKSGAVARLKYHLKSGRLKRVTREIYAVVPPGLIPDRFQPDSFLVAAAIRPEGVFSHHSALELLGAGHSVWDQCTLYVKRRRRLLALDWMTVCFLDHPKAMRPKGDQHVGTRKVERRGRLLEVTGPERTLVEGFRRPSLVGGLEELVISAAGFPILDLEVLMDVLQRYGVHNLWAAIGWFLERFQQTFHVPDAYLRHLESFRPGSPRYLVRGSRRGTLVPRWNLILPRVLIREGNSDGS
jgi:predicted transcriptional regulator of viral defense system